ncbi:PfkB family carbohydrate kinase [Flavilitoribacter nigricans]|uniref:Carbohydrate kinase n=1 Tax=Flavilitoribacter nigricans (strain ATCC 23147 / DSM 23189 / NBRC 102662 / NCIMB 1420 / SS-2) TaxID=1122177 RepID=A0A2D0NCN8_FLAN2|nr:PfkB family carbohydrate kinase [Flavilitoribacter nigricans]PHN06274.1 carbohydrate kinase [Flavilitoribacter nigricans DSM 23189 = NBRC 102662]
MTNELKTILEKIRKVKIAVYGDFCLDAYWILDPEGSEISVETGQQAASVGRQYYSPGGAGNVTANLAALQPASIRAIGAIGNDLYGRELKQQVQDLGVETASLVVQPKDFDTYAFVKSHLDEEEISRVDFGVNNQRSAATDQLLLESIRRALEEDDVLIFNQQVPDSITNAAFIEAVNQLIAKNPGKTVLLDSRHFNDQFQNIHLKINEVELARMNGKGISYQDYVSTEEIEIFGKETFKRYRKPVFVTCGDRGIIAFDEEGIHRTGGLQLSSTLDTTGAGDTAMSAIALSLGAGCSPAQAIRLANLAAAVTVQKVFTTGTASADEILQLATDPNFVYQPELAKSPQKATYLEGTEIELCGYVAGNRAIPIQHAVFDHDGTISTLREGWERIMEPVMIQAILGSHYQTADPGLYEKIRQRVIAYIDQSTGIQTIIQMEALAEMVREYGMVPKDQILDKFGYKEIFNDALLEMVNKRMEKFRTGQLHLEDFTIKGAVDFLHTLKNKGITLYLASGTDRDDVIKEAELLGYADLFDGGIHGSVGDVAKYSKKMVLEKIIRDNGLKGEELIAFGDGPVEIQECRKVGGITVGIACEEPRRYGLNLEKRSRLIRSGAQIIIPDYAQQDRLLELLF